MGFKLIRYGRVDGEGGRNTRERERKGRESGGGGGERTEERGIAVVVY